jgi:hypothetical protein
MMKINISNGQLKTNYNRICYSLLSDDEDIRENLSTASLDTIVERAKSAEPATQLAAVQVNWLPSVYCHFAETLV